MRRGKELLCAAAFVLTAAALLGLVSAMLRPARTDYGAVWGPYLAEPKHSLDYLYLGSSYAYCDINPGVIYEKTGLTGCVLAGPEQTLSTTYWYLKEALRTQSPKVVLLEASALHFDRYQGYTQVNVGYMPFSLNKLGAVFTSAEPELRTGLLFDLYFYHGRWKEVTPGEALRALLPPGPDLLKGYTAVSGAFEEIAGGPFRRETKDEALYRSNLDDLRRILELCGAKGVRPVVVFHPTYSQFAPEDYARVRSDVAAMNPGALFYDWSDDYAALGLVPGRHFYDPGHLNKEGADLFSTWLGDFMAEQLGLSPRPQTPENAAAWQAAANYWNTWTPPEEAETEG